MDVMFVAPSSNTGPVALPQKPVETKQDYSDAPVAKWCTCGCALLMAHADVFDGFHHSLLKVVTDFLDIKLK
ncbi:hypothetical protein DY000_02056917 [Brassica cretica]|uniref:Uncharacterized protein n=1 Tax=Brassica cretica TaxID=69181 RepID=A0ABQ7AFH3_BRACR|nr:hypothetical protein DY000_02056917 [Brassica cretica]